MNSDVRNLFVVDRSLRQVWQNLMLYDGPETLEYQEITRRCLDKLARGDAFSDFREAIAQGQDPNSAILSYLMGDPELFDGTGVEIDYERDFMESEPYFFARSGQPNCLGRPIVIASVYPRDSLGFMEVLRTRKLDQSFEELRLAARVLVDDATYTSEDHRGSPVLITGRDAKISILEGILYDEKLHATILKDDAVLDPVEAPHGKPAGTEYDVVSGITALTVNNLCGFYGLYAGSGDRTEEARLLIDDMLDLCPNSVSVMRNKVLFESDIRRQYEMMREIDTVYRERGIDVPHDIIGVQALQLAEMGDKAGARVKLNSLRERYILPDALEIVGKNCPAVSMAMELAA